MTSVTGAIAVLFVTIREFSFREADSFGAVNSRLRILKRFNCEKPTALPVSVFIQNSTRFTPIGLLFLPRLRKKLSRAFLAFVGANQFKNKNFGLDYSQRGLERLIRFRKFSFSLRRKKKITREAQKVIGRKFFIPFGPFMEKLGIRDAVQRMVNIRIHGFLRYYKKRREMLRTFGYSVRIRPSVTYKSQLYSKLL